MASRPAYASSASGSSKDGVRYAHPIRVWQTLTRTRKGAAVGRMQRQSEESRVAERRRVQVDEQHARLSSGDPWLPDRSFAAPAERVPQPTGCQQHHIEICVVHARIHPLVPGLSPSHLAIMVDHDGPGRHGRSERCQQPITGGAPGPVPRDVDPSRRRYDRRGKPLPDPTSHEQRTHERDATRQEPSPRAQSGHLVSGISPPSSHQDR